MDVHFGISMVYFQNFDCLKVFYLFYFLNIIDSRYWWMPDRNTRMQPKRKLH